MQLVRISASSPSVMTLGPALSPATGSNGCGGEGIFHAHMLPHGGGSGVSPPALVPSGLPYLCSDRRLSSSLLPLGKELFTLLFAM